MVAETLSPALADLAARRALSWRATEFSDSLVDDVFLVIAATEDEALNQRVFAAANARYRLVNVVDNRALCSFVFPSIVDRSPLLVAISSSGKRRYCRAFCVKNRSAAADESRSAGGISKLLAQPSENRLTTTEARRRFWERVFTGRFASLMVAGNSAEAEKALQDESTNPNARRENYSGRRRAGRCRAADPSRSAGDPAGGRGFHDHLVTQPVLELVRRDAELICVGKRAGSWCRSETNQLLVEAAKAGKPSCA